ncbi:high mobility group B protein 13 [Lingula anatina]|uniref:High mobility group B protein 13 n=1 Tax=Lingula anatina TaxID=7574 RepID=A0A1S3HQZ7_LINAN|nr:high mobility group B protein 13 [Lingula anatina]|eukprot:XP_013388465.1 high mobility group B protein 13 [Lingula anatina]
MEGELATTASSTNAVIVNGNIYSLSSLPSEGEKTDLVSDKLDPSNATGFIQDGGVIMETPKGLVWVNVSDLVNAYGNPINSVDLQSHTDLLDQQQQDVLDEDQVAKITDVHNDINSGLTLDNPLQLITSGTTVPVALTVVTPKSASSTTSTTEPIEGEPKKRRGGWPKGKKRKKDLGENKAPKAPITAYVLYAIERRQAIKASNPEIPFCEVTKILGNEWSSMSQDEKQKYFEAADKDKKRYVEQLKAYQQSEAFQTYLRKKKIRSLGDMEVSPEIDSTIMDLEEEDPNELYCKVCNMYFSSLHNKKEHMFGKQHLQAITGEFEKELQQQQTESETLGSEFLSSGSDQSLLTSSPPRSYGAQRQVDIDGFMQEFLERNIEREGEIRQLRKSLAAAKDQNMALFQKVQELKELDSKLEQDSGNLKAYGAALSAQIDGLKMVPTLFGVINF